MITENVSFLGYSELQRTRITNSYCVEVESPGLEWHENAIYIPGYDALYREDGTRIEASCSVYTRPAPSITPANLKRLRDATFRSAPSQVVVARPEKCVDNPVALIGNGIAHYGHFLLEGMSRLWALSELTKFNHFVMPSKLPRQYTLETAYADHFFRAVNINPEQIDMPSQTVLYRYVLIPKPSVNWSYSMYHNHASAHTVIGSKASIKRKIHSNPVYISRTKVKNGRTLIGEHELEDRLEKSGFTVVYPEQMSFEDQLSVFANSDIVIGSSGSAMHNIIFEPEDRIRNRFIFGDDISLSRFLMIDAVKSRSHRSTYINSTKSRRDEVGKIFTVIDVDKCVSELRGLALL